jgi:stage III sporulation protein AB
LRRAAALRQAMDAMQLLRIQMLERLLPLHAALEKSGFEPFHAEAAQLTKRGAMLDCLTADDLNALAQLFDGLGMTSRAEQEVLFSSALREVGRLESEAAKSGAEKGKLYTTLGLLCGLMLAIAFV